MLQECGADCAKFQKSELEYKFNRKALERPYTSKHSWGKTYGEHKRHLEFSHAQYKELQKYAEAHPSLWKTIFHETGSWCHKGWEPTLICLYFFKTRLLARLCSG